MIKINIFSFLSLCACVYVSAQSDNRGMIQSTQFPVNTYMINPAYAGAEEFTSLQASYKRNYLGLQEGPQTIYFSGHTRLQKVKKIVVEKYSRIDSLYPNIPTTPVRGRSSPMYQQIVSNNIDSLAKLTKAGKEDYKKRLTEATNKMLYRPYHGVGANLINESYLGSSRTGVGLTYAYHLYLTKSLRLSLGATLGLSSSTVNVEYRDAEPLSPQGKINPDLNLGAYLYHDKFYLGISGFNVIPNSPYKNLMSNATQKPIILATLGYKISFSEDLSVTPSILYRQFTDGVLPTSFDANARVNYKKLWLGFTYRNVDAVAFMLGINLFEKFDISYSYDHTISPINKFTKGGGHELILGYRLQRKNGSLVSRMFN
jgi:type IX secretion system PorP/SprF family membrane protein